MKTVSITLAVLALASPAAAVAAEDGATIVRTRIEEGARACMGGRPADVVKSYALDIRLQYPGVPDQGYEDLAKAYRRLCSGRGEGTVESTVPAFEEIYVSGPVVVARLTWTTRLRGMPAGASRQLRDVQIWEKRGGEWLFVRGVHYPVKAPQ
jgi:hypothetical protein